MQTIYPKRIFVKRVALLPNLQYNPTLKERSVKKVGLVGGTGPESTLMYYKKLKSLKRAAQRLSQNESSKSWKVEIHLQKLIELAKD